MICCRRRRRRRRRRRQNRELRGNQTEDRNRSKRQEQRQKGGRTTCYIFHLLICCRRRKIRKHIESRFVLCTEKKEASDRRRTIQHNAFNLFTLWDSQTDCQTVGLSDVLSDYRTYCRTVGRCTSVLTEEPQSDTVGQLSDTVGLSDCRTCRTVG